MESMDDYKDELEASFKRVNEGDVMTGTVIGVSENEVLLDLKYYTDGIIKLEDLTNDPTFNIKEDVNIGDEITATVIRRDDGAGHILLSKKEANDLLSWEKLQDMMDNNTIIHAKVKEVVNAGVIVFVEGIRGFVPASKLALDYVEDCEPYLGTELDLQIINVNQDDDKLVLSAKEILREKRAQELKDTASNLEVGLVTEGTVESIMPYGAFVNIGHGLSGLVHISQICEKRISSPASVLKVGEKVKVKVIAIKDGKISLSMKALLDVTATEIEEEHVDLPESEEISTSLGSLLAKFKL